MHITSSVAQGLVCVCGETALSFLSYYIHFFRDSAVFGGTLILHTRVQTHMHTLAYTHSHCQRILGLQGKEDDMIYIMVGSKDRFIPENFKLVGTFG